MLNLHNTRSASFNSHMNSDIAFLTRSNLKKDTKIRELKDKIESYEEILAEKNQKLDDLTSKLEEYCDEFRDLTTRSQNIINLEQVKNDAIERILKNHKKQIKEINKTYREQLKQILKDKNSNIIELRESAELKIRELEEKIRELEKQVDEYRKLLDGYQKNDKKDNDSFSYYSNFQSQDLLERKQNFEFLIAQ